MSAPNKRTPSAALDGIEDALVRSIMDAEGKALCEELVTAGLKPDELVAEFDGIIANAKSTCAKQRLENAKKELATFRLRKRGTTAAERTAARNRFEKARSGDPELASKIMMAARKGEGLSERDLDGQSRWIANKRFPIGERQIDSHIGYGSPHKIDTAAAHGEPLGEDEVRLAKRAYGWPEDAKGFGKAIERFVLPSVG